MAFNLSDVVVAAVLFLSPALSQTAIYNIWIFSDTASLLAAQSQGSFKSTEPLAIYLQPGVYKLTEMVAITAFGAHRQKKFVMEEQGLRYRSPS